MAKKPADKSKKDADKAAEAAAPAAGAEAAEPPAGGGDQPAAPPQMAMVINAQYIKDLSFEAPAAPRIFVALREAQPDISVDINVNAQALEEKAFEVILEFRSECKVKDEVGFILELQYAGVFTLNVPDEHLQPFLLIECPRMLFPFARNILADVSRDGGFPPVMLGPVDFAALYQAKMAELAQQGGQPAQVKPAS